MPIELKDFLKTELYSNTVQDYLMAFFIVLIVTVALYVLKAFVMVRLRNLAAKTVIDWDDKMLNFLDGISFFFYFVVSVYLVLGSYLMLPEPVMRALKILLVIAVIYELLKMITSVIDLLIDRYTAGSRRSVQNRTLKQGVKLIAGILVWGIGLVLILSNLGLEISALVASLGIGGIAVALAVQGVLGDLLSSFSLYFDRPFEVGDFIVVGNDMGTVTKIGFRTSRIQSLHGEEVVISNQDLSKARLQNFRRMEKRRVVINLSVTYDTNAKQLKKAKKIITAIVNKEERVQLDRVHFADFGEWALIFELVFYVLDSDYHVYMDVKEVINLDIIQAFEKEGIKFAFPTRTVFTE